jgi:hypothetical protein
VTKSRLPNTYGETPASKGSKYNSILWRFGILVGDETKVVGCIGYCIQFALDF